MMNLPIEGTKMSPCCATSSQCYKRFTGLYLQVCKKQDYFKPFVAASIDDFNKIMLFS